MTGIPSSIIGNLKDITGNAWDIFSNMSNHISLMWSDVVSFVNHSGMLAGDFLDLFIVLVIFGLLVAGSVVIYEATKKAFQAWRKSKSKKTVA